MSRKTLIIAVAVVVAGGVGAYFALGRGKTDVRYQEHIVKKGNIALTILSTGTVQPENRLEIKPPIAGRVEKVLVDEGQKVRKGQILAWMSSSERAALLDAARAQGEDEVKRWSDLYRPTPVIAPLNGTIILRNVESGQTFASTDSILSMSDRLTVKAQVDETDIAQIQLKQRAEIVLDAYSSQKIPAKVDKVSFDAKTVNNVTTYAIDVLPETTPEFMRSGMTANVTFLVANKEDVLTVPSQALKIQDGNTVVLVKDGSKMIERIIEPGATDGRQTEVVSGLIEGDVVMIPQMSANQRARGSSPFSPMGGARGGGSRGR